MKTKIGAFALSCLTGFIAWSTLPAQELGDTSMPRCEPGYTYVRETQYKEVERFVCKLVPYTKKTKKWVYDYKEAPFCIHKTYKGILSCVDCPTCKGPFSRKLLVKKLIVVKEEPATRCVVERVVEKVPCTVMRKVPLGSKNKSAEVPESAPLPEK